MARLFSITFLALLIACVGCTNSGKPGDNNVKTGDTRLTGAGATFIYPMMSKWASEYEKSKGVKINYQSIGSGGGIQQMTAQTVDYGCSEAPMNEEQIKKAKSVNGEVVHIPLAMGADVPCYNLSEATEPLKFSGPLLADIFLGKIKKWNDPALKAQSALRRQGNRHSSLDGSAGGLHLGRYLAKGKPRMEKQRSASALRQLANRHWSKEIRRRRLVQRTTGSIGYVELITPCKQNQVRFPEQGRQFRLAGKSVTATADDASPIFQMTCVIPSPMRPARIPIRSAAPPGRFAISTTRAAKARKSAASSTGARTTASSCAKRCTILACRRDSSNAWKSGLN